MKPAPIAVLALFLGLKGATCFGQGQAPQPQQRPLVTLDSVIIKRSQAEHLNVFFDATDAPESQVELSNEAVAGSTQNKVSQLASARGLSSLSRSSGTSLLWLRPNVMELAQRIVAGQSIQRIQEPTPPIKPLEELPLPFSKNSVSTAVGRPQINKDPWQAELQKTFGGILQRMPVQEDGAVATRVRRRLFELPIEMQFLAIARAQAYILRSSTGDMSSLWLTDKAWQGVTLTLEQLPNPVVQQADINKPRPLISLLAVKKSTLLNGGKQQNVSKVGVAVIPPQN